MKMIETKFLSKWDYVSIDIRLVKISVHRHDGYDANTKLNTSGLSVQFQDCDSWQLHGKKRLQTETSISVKFQYDLMSPTSSIKREKSSGSLSEG